MTCSRDVLSVDLDLDEPWVQTVVEPSTRVRASQKPVFQRLVDNNASNRKVRQWRIQEDGLGEAHFFF